MAAKDSVHIRALIDASLATEVEPGSLVSEWPGALKAIPMKGARFLAIGTRLLAVSPAGDCELLELEDGEMPVWSAVGPHLIAGIGGPPESGSVLRRDRLSRWWPGTYLLYQQGIEYFRPGEEPHWLGHLIDGNQQPPRIGPLPAYRDEATDELVPVLRIR
jgi:hypothetical protein